MKGERLRVLCVTPSGDAGRGGIDRLYQYVRQFAGDELAEVAQVRFFAARGRAPGVLWIAAFPWRLLLFTLAAAAWRPDVVHLNAAMGGSVYRKYALMLVAKLVGARIILHFHGQFTAAEAAAPSPMMRCFLRLCRRADAVLVLGEAYRRAFVAAGVPAEKVAVLANGIPDFAADLPLPKLAGERLLLLFAGEVGERKGVDILIAALGRLAATTRAWTCIVAGNGDLEPYHHMAGKAGVASLVRFTGWVDAEEMHELMRACDVVVLPSRSEALPLALIEGACAGAALIATPVGEVGDVVVPGENGILVEPDAAALAAAIGSLCEHRDDLGRMQAASRRLYAERFELRVFLARLGALYRAVAAGTVAAHDAAPSVRA